MKPGLSDRLARLKKAQREAKGSPGGQSSDRGSVPGGTAGGISPGGHPGRTNGALPDGAAPPAAPAVPAFEKPEWLDGEWTSPARDLWVKKRVCPSPLTSFRSSGHLCREYPDQSKWLFYDTETTGLSGGAGNIPFLVGIGRPAGDEFHITQFFLKDYPGEPALLSMLKEEIARSSLFISYNGKSFDRPLLETRFLMNRMPCRMGDQLDLLYPVRSLFRNRMPNCRLGTVEEQLLGIQRHDDIPGAEIPDIWFSFLKEGEHPDLNRVMVHNDMDILSLAVLVKELENFLIDPDSLVMRDPAALGRFLLDRDDERGMHYLEEGAARSDVRAEYLLSVQLKRRGEWQRAAELWTTILERRFSPYAALEMAKYLEHRRKDYPGALTLTERLIREHIGFREGKHHQALVHRRKRLTSKIGKKLAGGSEETLE